MKYRILKANTRASRLRLALAGEAFVKAAPKKLKDMYEENYKGFLVDHDSPNILMTDNRWVAVATHEGRIGLICKYNNRADVDLSEVVKDPEAPEDVVWTLFKWAYFNERPADRRLTLTAATRKLVDIYEGYGFTLEAAAIGRVAMVSIGNPFARVNAPMVFTQVKTELLEQTFYIIPV